jgi:CRISPR/Cas system-associated protein Cas7 (RAMP superfamily)
MDTTNFTFKLSNEMNYKGVAIMLYDSTEGWFVETSQGLVSEYMKTKKEALEAIKNIKNNIKNEIAY